MSKKELPIHIKLINDKQGFFNIPNKVHLSFSSPGPIEVDLSILNEQDKQTINTAYFKKIIDVYNPNKNLPKNNNFQEVSIESTQEFTQLPEQKTLQKTNKNQAIQKQEFYQKKREEVQEESSVNQRNYKPLFKEDLIDPNLLQSANKEDQDKALQKRQEELQQFIAFSDEDLQKFNIILESSAKSIKNVIEQLNNFRVLNKLLSLETEEKNRKTVVSNIEERILTLQSSIKASLNIKDGEDPLKALPEANAYAKNKLLNEYSSNIIEDSNIETVTVELDK